MATTVERQTIRIHAAAPGKPAIGSACNGCGVCCLAEPCPVGALVSLRLRGACAALRWDEARHRYDCGLLAGGTVGAQRGSRSARWLNRAVRSLIARLIAAGSGCDSDATVESGRPPH